MENIQKGPRTLSRAHFFSIFFTKPAGFLQDSQNSTPFTYFILNVQLLNLIFHVESYFYGFHSITKFSLTFSLMFHQFHRHFAEKKSYNSYQNSVILSSAVRPHIVVVHLMVFIMSDFCDFVLTLKPIFKRGCLEDGEGFHS